jgi:hypothetical protein
MTPPCPRFINPPHNYPPCTHLCHLHRRLPHIVAAMRDFPHDTLASEQVSLSQFTHLMQQASRAADPLDYINAALCGRVILDRPHRVVLNARQDLDSPHDPSFTRDFDSAIGITCNLPFTAPLNIYPVPSFKDTLKKRNHVLGPIDLNNVSPGSLWVVGLYFSDAFLAHRVQEMFIMFHLTRFPIVAWALWSIVTSQGYSFLACTLKECDTRR